MYNFFQIAKLLESWGFSKSKVLYASAKQHLGKKVSGIRADISVGCVEGFETVYKNCFGSNLQDGLHTTQIFKVLNSSYKFRKLNGGEVGREGDIIIAVTGSGLPGKVGHIGIISDNMKIMSNNSLNGLWDEHLDVSIWIKRYIVDYRMDLHIFRQVL